MHLTVLQENLAKGLSIVGRAVSSRSTLPVLSNVLLSTEDGRLKLAATNLEVGVTCWLGAQIMDDGAITLPARLLTDWVSSMPADPIEMDLVVRTASAHLRCARVEANIKGIDATEFPLIPNAEGMPTMRLATPTLRQMIDQVVFAASSDESRASLTGVLARFEGQQLTLAATDGYRLSVRRTTLPDPVPEATSIIIPARALSEVARIAGEGDADKDIEFAVSPARSQAMFRIQGKPGGERGFEQVDMVSQLIDAKFPDFNAIIPKSFVTRTTMDTAALLKALKVALLFARDVANNVRLQIEPGTESAPGSLVLRANSAEVGDNISEIDAMVEGSALEIAFNARYMIDVLAVIDSPRVVLETTQANRPGLLRPVGTGPDEFTHVIMPMQIQR